MDIKCDERETATCLTVAGKLDLMNAVEVKEMVKALLERDRTKIHIDMSGVDFINSSGLGAMVSMLKEIRMRQGRLTLSNLAPYIVEIFEITQLSNVFEIYNTVEEAMASQGGVPATP
jgi:anti-sigma B factor antagonist